MAVPILGAEMWGDTTVPYLGGWDTAVPSWGAEMLGDTAVPYSGGLGHGVALLSHIWGDWDVGWHCCPLFGGWDVG